MNKKELLGFIKGLPDETEILMVDGSDFDIIEIKKKGVKSLKIEPCMAGCSCECKAPVVQAEEESNEDQGN